MKAAIPTLTGTLAVGSSLTAVPGAWTPGVRFTYQWFADGRPISSATKRTFVLTKAQQGRQISVKATGAKAGLMSLARTSVKTAKVTVAGKVSVSGTRAIGSTLTAKRGTWLGKTTFRYQWFADGVAIPRATTPKLRLTGKETGKRIAVSVTGSRSGYATVVRTSPATAKVQQAPQPTISGVARVTSTLRAKAGVWTTGTKLSYRWYANGKAISKATSASLKLTKSRKGKKITVKVTGKLAGYSTITRTSSATRKVS